MSNISLSLGCDFSFEHLEAIIHLNRIEKQENLSSRVTNVYGSPGAVNPFGSVRPSARETSTSITDFCKVCNALHSMGIKVNLTLNSLTPRLKANGKDRMLFDDEQASSIFIEFIQSIERVVDNLIIAHPRIIDCFHEDPRLSNCNFGIIVSTIMNVHTLPQLVWIKHNWPKVIMVCPALEKNRNFQWLIQAQHIIDLELLANEFCSIGGVTCEGLYRQSCYLSQSLELQDYNPMKTRCMASREGNMEAWLRANFILPQWMSRYQRRTDVSHFKVTGRTHKAKYIKQVGEMYIREKATGNLLGLWGQLQATLNKDNWKDEQDKAVKDLNIPIKSIENAYFSHCDPDACGIQCSICKGIANDISEEQE